MEHGRSKAAVMLHEARPSSTPDAAEMPHGAPSIAHPIAEEISHFTGHSRNINLEDTVIVPPGPMENLALEHGKYLQ